MRCAADRTSDFLFCVLIAADQAEIMNGGAGERRRVLGSDADVMRALLPHRGVECEGENGSGSRDGVAIAPLPSANPRLDGRPVIQPILKRGAPDARPLIE